MKEKVRGFRKHPKFRGSELYSSSYLHFSASTRVEVDFWLQNQVKSAIQRQRRIFSDLFFSSKNIFPNVSQICSRMFRVAHGACPRPLRPSEVAQRRGNTRGTPLNVLGQKYDASTKFNFRRFFLPWPLYGWFGSIWTKKSTKTRSYTGYHEDLRAPH